MHPNHTPPAAPAEAKHTHYVSLENGCIHQALSSPVGYEDEHPSEWRPANPSEIERYMSGDARPANSFNPMPLSGLPGLVASPSTIELAPEDDLPAPPAPPADWQSHVAPTAAGAAPAAPAASPEPAEAPAAPPPAPPVAPAIEIPPAASTSHE